MPFLRPLHLLRTATLRTTSLRPTTTPIISTSASTILHRPRTYATQDYGSGDGHPIAEDPQKQARGREDLEHPGPEPPKVAGKDGKSTSASSSGKKDGGGKDSSGKSASYGKKGNGGEVSAGSKKKGGEVKDGGKTAAGGGKKPQPKLAASGPPAKEDESGDVKKHNEEMEGRAEKAGAQIPNH